MIKEKTALIIIDVQKGFDEPYWGSRNNPQMENNIIKLLHQWRQQKLPIIHIQHCSINLSSPLHPTKQGNAYKDEVSPQMGETQFKKTVNSAFIGTNLEKYLRKNNISTIVIVGLTTDHCVSTTTRMAGNLGFNVYLVVDATATFNKRYNGKEYSAEEVHNIHLASLNDEFCSVLKTQSVLNSLI